MKVCSETEKQHIITMYSRLDIEESNYDELFYNGVLDIFPKKLSEEECQKIKFSELYKTHEHKFISFFSHMYHLSGVNIFVRPITVISTSEKYMSVRGLNKDEQKFIREFGEQGNQLFKLDNIDDLNVLVKATIREVVLSIFYLKDMFIVGNYD